MSAQDQFEAAVERAASGGWVVRVPLRREDVRLEKRTVIGERLLIGRRQVEDVEHVEADLRRERLRVEGEDIDATQSPEATTRLDRGAHQQAVASADDHNAAERTGPESQR